MTLKEMSRLPGYNHKNEIKRLSCWHQFWRAKSTDEQREALRGHASCTALRSPPFIAALELKKGIPSA